MKSVCRRLYQLSLWVSKYIAQVLPINIPIPKHFKVESYLTKSLKNKVLVPHWESPLGSEITKAVKNSEDEKNLMQMYLMNNNDQQTTNYK